MYDRDFLKADLWEGFDSIESDQRKGLPIPEMQKPVPPGAKIVELIPYEKMTAGRMPVIEAIARRESRRKYTGESIDLETLSFLLWATQGVKKIAPNKKWIQRTVPSGGARHPFETYLLVNHVEGLEKGLYRYLGIEHRLCLLSNEPGLAKKIHKGSNDQFVLPSAGVALYTGFCQTDRPGFRAFVPEPVYRLRSGRVGNLRHRRLQPEIDGCRHRRGRAG